MICKKCKTEYSDSSGACPECGTVNSGKLPIWMYISAGVSLVVVVSFVVCMSKGLLFKDFIDRTEKTTETSTTQKNSDSEKIDSEKVNAEDMTKDDISTNSSGTVEKEDNSVNQTQGGSDKTGEVITTGSGGTKTTTTRIPACAHEEQESYTETITNATCDKCGLYKVIKKCKSCKQEIESNTKESPTLGHKKSLKTEPRTDKNGNTYQAYYCTVCKIEMGRATQQDNS